MLPRLSTILGIGLLVLWIAGLGNPAAAKWLTWLEGVAAVCAFGIAIFAPASASRNTRASGPIALSLGLFALWIIALASNVVPWLTWWTFVFAMAFLGLGIRVAREKRPLLGHTPSEIEKERMKRGA